MKAPLIALDLDGTLLDSEKNISQKNIDALRAAFENGAEIVPCTGRCYAILPQPVKDLTFVRYVITANGSAIYDVEAGRDIAREDMDCETAVRVARWLEENTDGYECYIDNVGCMERTRWEFMMSHSPEIHKANLMRYLRTEVPLSVHIRDTNSTVQNFWTFVPDPEKADALRADLAVRFPELAVTASLGFDLEIHRPEADKGHALLKLAGMLGRSPEETVAFGDGLNDISMIRAAAVGIAMENAEPRVKEAADRITASNDEDGVAAALLELGII